MTVEFLYFVGRIYLLLTITRGGVVGMNEKKREL